jgi:hypothetical protein
MRTASQLTPAQRRMRKSVPKGSSKSDRDAQPRIQLRVVRESVFRLPDRPRA